MFGSPAGSRNGVGARARTLATRALTAVLIAVVLPNRALAQVADSGSTMGGDLDAIVRRANISNPAIRAAEARASAAQARVGPAATRPDPMLMAGIVNLPFASSPVLSDPMTMKMIGVSQTILYPGKLPLARHIAELEADGARAAIDVTRRDVERSAKQAYYEIAYLDRAIEVTTQTSGVLSDVIRVTEAHYSAGTGAQQDVLKARVEAARASETANMLVEQRRAAVAQLNAVLNEDSAAPVAGAAIPEKVVRAALARDPAQVRFTAPSLGSPAAGSPLPTIAELQNLAIAHSPVLREHEAMIAARTAQVELARKAYKPDIDLSLQYGQRTGRPDMISAQVTVPLKLHRRSREDQQLAEANAELMAENAEHEVKVNDIRQEVARLASELERNRTQLALYTKAILPQGRAAVTAALASYQAGRVDLLTVLDNQNTIFTYETAYYRALTDFATNLAKLDQVVGVEVLP
ncbi:MAG: TolC family protein [Gemmatimonadaceae bacterium]